MALYLSLAPEVCIGEILRHISPSLLPELNDYRLTEIHLTLQRVIDLRHVQLDDFSPQNLATTASYEVPQTVARLAIERGAEALLVPSATRLGDNLVVFPEFLNSGSEMTIMGSRDPVLYVPQTD